MRGIALTENIIMPLFKSAQKVMQKHLDKCKGEIDKFEDVAEQMKTNVNIALVSDLVKNLGTQIDSKNTVVNEDIKNQILSYIFPYLKLDPNLF